jgi:tetraacyldisaccharide 4'-kinase
MKRPWLTPLAPLYAAGVAARDLGLRLGWKPVSHLRWPVVSIGNLSTGGAGKTPFTIALARLLAAKGFSIDVLSRGYGRRSKRPTRVLVEGTVDEFGDEPLLIARATGLPVYVAPQRYDAGQLAEAEFDASRLYISGNGQFSPTHILDDGFQHRQLARDVDILLLNRHDWRDTLLPAGNLREGLHAAKRADVIAIPAEDPEVEREIRAWGLEKPVWRLHRRMEIPAIDDAVAAFCGIAHPEQFFNGLERAGLQLSARTAFRDHHRYNPRDVQNLQTAARSAAATSLITTEKDAVRLEMLAVTFPATLPLKTARLHIEIENETAALEWLVSRLASRIAEPSL